jgi:hypothetical protein
VLPAVAGAHVASTTLKFTAVTNKHVTFTRSTFGMQETDVSSTGKTIGFDDVYVTLTGTNMATANVALDVKGGFLYGVVTTTDGGKTFSGKVTGGPGRSRERPARSPARPPAARRRRSRSSTAEARQPYGGRDGLRSQAVPPAANQDRQAN